VSVGDLVNGRLPIERSQGKLPATLGISLNLKPHLHIIALDGVYNRYGERARFRNIDFITDDEVAALIQLISTKVMDLCVRRGYLSKDGEPVAHPDLDPLFQDYDAFALAKAFKIDVTKCDDCGGQMKKISAIMDPVQVRRYLKHVNIDYEPPTRGPPRHQQGEFDFEAVQCQRDVEDLAALVLPRDGYLLVGGIRASRGAGGIGTCSARGAERCGGHRWAFDLRGLSAIYSLNKASGWCG